MSDPKMTLTLREMIEIIMRFAPYARHYWKYFLAGIGATIMLNSAGVVQPYVLKVLTDKVLTAPSAEVTSGRVSPTPGAAEGTYASPAPGKTTPAPRASAPPERAPEAPAPRTLEEKMSTLHWCLLFLLGTAFLKGIFLYAQAYMMAWGNNATIKEIREDVYRHIQTLPLAWFDRVRLGDVIVRLTDNVRIVTELLAAGLIVLMNDLIVTVGAITYMVIKNPMMTFLAFFLTPITIKLIDRLDKAMERIVGSAQDNVSDMASQIQETLAGIRVVKAFCREDHESRRYKVNSTETYKLALRMTGVMLAQNPLVEVVSTISLVIVIGYGSYAVSKGAMTLGDFLAFWGYLLLASTPLSRITSTVSNLRRGLLAARTVFELKDIEAEVQERPGAIELSPIRESISFEDVTFGYNATIPVLRDVSFSVPYGKMVAIVGHNGAGKSTLISLISRFYDPQGGRIVIDGHDLRDTKLDSLRRQVAFVLQDNILFSGTVRDNIKYGRPQASDDEVIAAARVAQCHDLVMGFPQQYDTAIVEGGRGLSGGQRQRIAIARAILADPRILILDEATSSLDPESERGVQNALHHLMQGRSSFVIAHRLSTVRRADLLLVMQDGRVVERGTHDELLAQSGVYRKAHNLFYSIDDDSAQDLRAAVP